MLSLVRVGHNYWHPIIATSFSQDNSSEFSPVMPEEFGEHLIRDKRTFLHSESLQILQIHSSILVLLLFSLPHSFSTGFRSEYLDGHGRSLILCSVTNFCVDFYVCFGLLPWWKIQPRPIIKYTPSRHWWTSGDESRLRGWLTLAPSGSKVALTHQANA